MELYGLKAKDGTEYKLIVPKENETIAFTRAIEVTPEPKFKVGDWVIAINTNRKDCIFRISEVGATSLQGTDFRHTAPNYRNWEFNSVRLATKDEIETHLRKIADEKYVGKVARCLDYEDDVFEISEFARYDYCDEGAFLDRLIYLSDEGGKCMVIYEKGKWAEIVPSKKKLPKTKSEFGRFLCEYLNKQESINRVDITVDDFLKDYED